MRSNVINEQITLLVLYSACIRGVTEKDTYIYDDGLMSVCLAIASSCDSISDQYLSSLMAIECTTQKLFRASAAIHRERGKERERLEPKLTC